MIKIIIALWSLGFALSQVAGAATQPPLKVPFKFALGKSLYQDKCGSCHGVMGEGTPDKGPPMLHDYYKPSHHGDASFYRASIQGVKAHHWKFGDMEPVPGVGEREVDKILPYVRWLQRQHGIQ